LYKKMSLPYISCNDRVLIDHRLRHSHRWDIYKILRRDKTFCFAEYFRHVFMIRKLDRILKSVLFYPVRNFLFLCAPSIDPEYPIIKPRDISFTQEIDRIEEHHWLFLLVQSAGKKNNVL